MVFQLIWFDSMGAKSSSTLVTTPDTSILIDPGAAIMQPTFPLQPFEKWSFFKMREHWAKSPWVDETLEGIHFAGGVFFQAGDTKIRFSRPLFHGIEYANTGWVISTIIEHGDNKLIHTSDLQGPTIEDHAKWIIDENPNILIVDGPATYLLGYMLNTTNLNRSIENAVRIIEECDLDVMIYDHHLLRDPLYKQRTSKIWECAEDVGVMVTTAAEYNGIEPVVLNASV